MWLFSAWPTRIFLGKGEIQTRNRASHELKALFCHFCENKIQKTGKNLKVTYALIRGIE
jgi:hypothetical protein